MPIDAICLTLKKSVAWNLTFHTINLKLVFTISIFGEIVFFWMFRIRSQLISHSNHFQYDHAQIWTGNSVILDRFFISVFSCKEVVISESWLDWQDTGFS